MFIISIGLGLDFFFIGFNPVKCLSQFLPSFPPDLALLKLSYLSVFIFCRRHKEKKDETTEPEADPERDQRTVFAYQVRLCTYFISLYLVCLWQYFPFQFY